MKLRDTYKSSDMTKAVIITVVLAIAFVGSKKTGWYAKISDAFKNSGTYTVATFYDGDTFGILMNGKEEKIRLIGVDTPETHHPDIAAQCFGEKASNFTKELVGSQRIRLEADPMGTNRDRYDRLLRYAYLPDGRLVNAEIIKQGYGFAYTSFPFTKIDEFKSYQDTAQAAKIGLWVDCRSNFDSGRGQTNPATN